VILETYEPKISDDVQAVQLTAANAKAVAAWCRGEALYMVEAASNKNCFIGLNLPTQTGVRLVAEGDYVLRKRTGDFQTMTYHTFEGKYRRKSNGHS